jgi:hypothetical protein
MAGLHIQRFFGQNRKVGSSFIRIPYLPVTELISEQEKRASVPYMYRSGGAHAKLILTVLFWTLIAHNFTSCCGIETIST